MVEYLIRCHCGALSARYQTAQPVASWNVRACQCSFCRAHDALSISDPAGRLEFSARSPERLQRYRFGSGITEFLLCRDAAFISVRAWRASRAPSVSSTRERWYRFQRSFPRRCRWITAANRPTTSGRGAARAGRRLRPRAFEAAVRSATRPRSCERPLTTSART